MRHSLGWLAAILLILGAVALAKLSHGPYGLDASQYVQIARHVARGEGLITTTSLFHQGEYLPARSNAHPLWILTLGYAGRFLGMERAAAWLPKFFYFVDLILLYFLTRAVALRIGLLRLGSHWLVPDVAHLVTLLFGLNLSFYATTTHPYREGISFCVAFAALLALERFVARRSLLAAAAAGVFSGLAYLGRVQLAAVGISIVAALLIGAWRDRRYRIAIALVIASGIVVVMPWFLFLHSIPRVYEWDRAPTVTLPVVQDPPRHMPLPELVAESFEGLVEAFRLGSNFAYTATFGVAAFLVPLAFLAALLRIRAFRRFLDAGATVHATLLAGLLMFVTLLPFRSDFLPYFFGWRQGQTLIFLLIVAVPFLAARWRWLTLALIAISIVTGALNIARFIRQPEIRYTAAEEQLTAWLEGQSKGRRLTLLTTNPQLLGLRLEANVYGTFCGSTPETTRVFLSSFPIDYVLVYDRETRCPFQRGLGRELRVVASFGAAGERVYVLQPLR